MSDPRSTQLINTLHELYCTQIARKVAIVLGKNDDAAKYQADSSAIAAAIQKQFFDPAKHSYVGGEEAYLAFPLLLGIVPGDEQAAVINNLRDTILVRNSGHLDTGMHGTYFLLKYLMEADRDDLIYTMASKTDFPGWGYMLDQGATTSWEDWSGKDTHIHDTLISIGSWFIQGIGGISIDESQPGFRHFLVKPSLVGDLTFAKNSYRCPYGLIVSNWRIENGQVHLDVTVPPGASATVYVPAGSVEDVLESGAPLAQSSDVKPITISNRRVLCQIESGEYHFTAKMTAPK